METCGQIFHTRPATQTTSLWSYSATLPSWLVLTAAPARAAFSEIEQNTGINTGIQVVVFFQYQNTGIAKHGQYWRP